MLSYETHGWLFWPLIFVLGSLISSFYQATAERVIYFFYGPGRKDPVSKKPLSLKERYRLMFTRPSFCMSCLNPVRRLYLIPVAGYFFTKGKCSHCGEKILSRFPVTETAGGLTYCLLIYWSGSFFFSTACLFYTGHLLVSYETDRRLFLLDHENHVFLAVFALLAVHFSSQNYTEHLLTAAGTCALFTLLYFIMPGRLGFADIGLVTSIALFHGMPWILLTVETAALMSIIYILWLKKNPRSPAPFGSMLASSSYIVMLAGIAYQVYNPDAAFLKLMLPGL